MESATAIPIKITTSPFVTTKNGTPKPAIIPNALDTVAKTMMLGSMVAVIFLYAIKELGKLQEQQSDSNVAHHGQYMNLNIQQQHPLRQRESILFLAVLQTLLTLLFGHSISSFLVSITSATITDTVLSAETKVPIYNGKFFTAFFIRLDFSDNFVSKSRNGSTTFHQKSINIIRIRNT